MPLSWLIIHKGFTEFIDVTYLFEPFKMKNPFILFYIIIMDV